MSRYVLCHFSVWCSRLANLSSLFSLVFYFFLVPLFSTISKKKRDFLIILFQVHRKAQQIMKLLVTHCLPVSCILNPTLSFKYTTLASKNRSNEHREFHDTKPQNPQFPIAIQITKSRSKFSQKKNATIHDRPV